MPTAMTILSPSNAVLLRASVLTDQRVRIEEAGHAGEGLHPVAGELVLQHLDLVVERHAQPGAEVLALDVLLDPIGEAVEPALAPARKVEHRLAQRLGRDRAGMHRDAADPQPVLDHQHICPSLAAWIAARRPAGPLPMTMRSYRSTPAPALTPRARDYTISAGRSARHRTAEPPRDGEGVSAGNAVAFSASCNARLLEHPLRRLALQERLDEGDAAGRAG